MSCQRGDREKKWKLLMHFNRTTAIMSALFEGQNKNDKMFRCALTIIDI